MEWPGESVLTRLLDLLENGIGGALRPWQIRRVEAANAEARIQERLLLAQAEKDIADLRAGRKRIDATGRIEELEGPKPLLLEGAKVEKVGDKHKQEAAVQTISEDARDAAHALEMQRAVNLKRTALFAEEEAEAIDRQHKTHRPAEEPSAEVDADWFSKWRTGAQDVSREEMQRLWAKLLSGEVAKPGTYSLHTVDFLSRMSSSDAMLLAKMAPFVTSGGIIKLGEDFFKSKGIRFEDLLYLDDMGIINGTVSGLGGLNYTLGNVDVNGKSLSTLLCNGTALVFDMGESAKAPQKLSFEVLTTTRIGREIFSLASFTADEEYLKAVAEKGINSGAFEVQRGVLHPNGRQLLGLHIIASK